MKRQPVAIQRVRRNLSRDEVEELREQIFQAVPAAGAEIADLIRRMRLVTRKSQVEYAKWCGVAPRVLAELEAGKRNVRVETLEKLVRPFGYRIGIVNPGD